MANNSLESGNIILIDPNRLNNGEHLRIEDLNIYVSLSVTRRNRMYIGNDIEADKIVIEGSFGGNETINILSSSGIGIDNSLTTAYTELSTEFGKGKKNLESFGMERISIDFDTSYTPIVTIDFVDVRGKLFEQNKNSLYNFFFDLPYPMFELTVKGFLGKSVSYCLHLTKFSAKFNDRTGNFELTCNFIGYTYAFLTDILMAYIKAIPGTKCGREKILERKRLSERTTSAKGSVFMTIGELDEKIQRLGVEVEKMKEDEKIKQLSLAEEIVVKLDELKSLIVDKLILMNNGLDLASYKNGYINIIKSKPVFDRKRLDTYNGIIKNQVENINKKINSEKYKLNYEDFIIKYKKNFYRGLNVEDFFDINDGVLEEKTTISNELKNKIFKLSDEYTNIDEKEKFYNDLKSIINITYNDKKINDKTNFDIIYLIDIVNKIDETKNRIRNDVNFLRETISNDFSEKLENLLAIKDKDGNIIQPFKPTIYNIFKILCDHVDIFMECLEDIGNDILKNKEKRKSDLSEIIGNLDSSPKSDVNVSPFPEYREKDFNSGAFVEKWIGSKAPNLPEVKFVGEMLDSMLKVASEDRATFSTIKSQQKQGWLPTNPLDTPLIINNDIYNIYELVDNGKWFDVIKFLGLRLTSFLGLAARKLDEEDIKAFAKSEVRAIFNSIKNDEVLDIIFSGLNDEGSEYISDIISSMTGEENIKNYNKFLIDGKEIYVNGPSIIDKVFIQDSSLFGLYESKKEYYSYKYDFYFEGVENITDVDKTLIPKYSPPLSEDNFRTVLPIYIPDSKNNNKLIGGGFLTIKNSYDKYFKNDIGDFVSNSERIKLRDSGVIFISDYTGYGNNSGEKVDDGSTFIKIINREDYDRLNISLNDDISEAVEKVKGENIINLDSIDSMVDIVEEKRIIDGSIFNGKYGFREFFWCKVNDEHLKFGSGDIFPHYLYFYGFKSTTNADSDDFINRKLLLSQTDEYDLYSIDTLSGKKINFNFNKAKQDIFKNIFSNGNKEIIYEYQDVLYETIDGVGDNNIVLSLSFKTFDSAVLNKEYFVFGSKFYYYQDNEYARAYIFLSSIFEYFNKLMLDFSFSVSNGFIEVPYSFILYIGSILKRLDNDYIKHYDLLDWADIELPSGDKFTDTYKMNFEILLKDLKYLPESVKNEFIKEFENWVNSENGWKDIYSKLEIFNRDSNGNFDTSIIDDYYTNFKDDINRYSNNILSENINDYNIFLNDSSENDNFFLLTKSNGVGVETVINFLHKTKIIANGSWRIWVDLSDIDFDKKSQPFFISDDDFNIYKLSFKNEFIKQYNLKIEGKKTDFEKEKETIFGTLNNEDILLRIYKNFKSIYDKWISGGRGNCAVRTLIDRFKFIDRAYNDISDDFLINPVNLIEYISKNPNTNLYSIIEKILTDNKMLFIPLPNYINYNDKNEIEDVFKPFKFNESANTTGPQFVCVYVGELSNSLDLSDGNFENDGMDIKIENGALNLDNIGDDFKKNNTEKIPFFVVRYADENQSIFSNIKLDQSEFTETNETLYIIDEISKRGSFNEVTSIGQNLYDIYKNRSYSIEVEMLGNVQIQPFMYFQVEKIPMFHGVYMIIKVSHTIKANSVITKFKGIRVRKYRTKYIDKSTLFMNLIGNLSNTNFEDVKLTNLNKLEEGNISIDSGRSVEEPNIVFNDLFMNPTDNNGNKLIVPIIISNIGYRNLNGNFRIHEGIDIAFRYKNKNGLKIINNENLNEIFKDDNVLSENGVIRKNIELKAPYDSVIYGVKLSKSVGLILDTYVKFNDRKDGYILRYLHLIDIDKKIIERALVLYNKQNGTNITYDDWLNNSFNTNGKDFVVSNFNYKVKKGETLGLVGGLKNTRIINGIDTAGKSTGTHLHLELLYLDENNFKVEEISKCVSCSRKSLKKIKGIDAQLKNFVDYCEDCISYWSIGNDSNRYDSDNTSST
jgi:hypothetical protein